MKLLARESQSEDISPKSSIVVDQLQVLSEEVTVEESTPKTEEDNITLEDKIRAWSIKYFKHDEIVNLHNPKWEGDLYMEPPLDIVDNIHDTLIVADAIREEWAKRVGHKGNPRVRVNSGWRPLEYNRLVGSTDTSEHVQFRALDLSPMNGDYEGFAECAKDVVARMRKEDGLNIGVGYYGRSRFVHIDTNAEGKRKNRTWNQ